MSGSTHTEDNYRNTCAGEEASVRGVDDEKGDRFRGDVPLAAGDHLYIYLAMFSLPSAHEFTPLRDPPTYIPPALLFKHLILYFCFVIKKSLGNPIKSLTAHSGLNFLDDTLSRKSETRTPRSTPPVTILCTITSPRNNLCLSDQKPITVSPLKTSKFSSKSFVRVVQAHEKKNPMQRSFPKTLSQHCIPQCPRQIDYRSFIVWAMASRIIRIIIEPSIFKLYARVTRYARKMQTRSKHVTRISSGTLKRLIWIILTLATSVTSAQIISIP